MPVSEEYTYTDLTLRIFPWDTDEEYYPVEATLSDGSRFTGGELHLNHNTLQLHELDPEQYGRDLFYALFSGKAREAYDVATGLANGETAGRLRLRIWIDANAPELHAIPWERLCQQSQAPTTTSAATPFSRYMELPSAEPEPVARWPRRLLFAVANPADLDEFGLTPLDVEGEVRNLIAALDTMQKTGLLRVTLMPGHTGLSDELRAEVEAAGYEINNEETDFKNILQLLNQESYHILHFLGHGRFNRRDGSAMLYMENRNGNAKPIKDQEIAEGLKVVATRPHLMFIASCESATRDPDKGNAFVGLAPQMVQAGIPAVVAMQDFMPIASAQTLIQDFYRNLLQHGFVDVALNQARLLLYGDESQDWDIPTLFMRLKQGQLFTKAPVRTALDMMVHDKLYNPLPANEPYLPVEVLRLSGDVDATTLRNVVQEPAPTMTLLDAVQKVFDPTKADIGPHGPSLIALVGDEGMGKSVSLRYLGHLTAQNSLKEHVTHIVIPVYIDLQDLPRDARIDNQAIKNLVLKSLEPFWKGKEQHPEELLRAHTGPILRVMVDGGDGLPDHTQYRAWEALNRFVMENSRSEYIVAFSLAQFDPQGLMLSDVLMMQPMSPRNIQRFLIETLTDPAGQELYDALVKANLFDLAALPWLLFTMLKHTQRGNPPESHAQVIQNVVEDRIMDIATDRGMRAKAAETLYALAWEMQTRITPILSVERAFKIMTEVRGNRGYDLEELYQQLIQGKLLEPVGEESLSFTRAIIRAYCFAQAIRTREDRDWQLDNITATLGRYNRYRWWENALILLSGLMEEPEALIRQILYGVSLSEGEQVFLAARCIQESDITVKDEQELITYIVNTLIWRLRNSDDPRITRRIRLIQALEQLNHPAMIPHLAELANQPEEQTGVMDEDYESSTIKLAAVTALQRMVIPPYEEIAAVAPHLAKLLSHWAKQEVEALIPYLYTRSADENDIQAVAAFALGSLKTQRATDAVIKMYMLPTLHPTTRRNVTTAVSLLDAAIVTERIILPLLDPNSEQDRTPWYRSLAYLIGKIRAQDSTARTFLHSCLLEYDDVRLKGLAIQSLGWLYDLRSKRRFEDIALGDLKTLNLSEMDAALPRNKQYLQHKALDALRYLGDRITLIRLQKRATGWTPELERAFYWTIEEIIARQNEK